MKYVTLLATLLWFNLIGAQTPVFNADGFLISGDEVRVNNQPLAGTHQRMSGCDPFFEGWESSSYTPTWTQGTAPITFTIENMGAASGMYALKGVGGNSTHLTGLSTVLPAAQTPDYFSWKVKKESVLTASSYVVIGNSSISATNCIVFSYINLSATLRFVSSITLDIPVLLNTWYTVELKNVDYSAHTFDIYLDGVLQQTGFPFRGPTIGDMDRIHLYNFNGGSIGFWDDIKVCQEGAALNQNSSVTYSTLQDAINGAASGDTIKLLQNLVESNLTISNSVVLKSGVYSLDVSGTLDVPVNKTLTWFENTLNIAGAGIINNNGTLHNKAIIQNTNPVNNTGVYKGTGQLTGNLLTTGQTQPGN